MRQPEALDVFCGEGGTSEGLAQAGFRVTGVDNDPARLEKYPHEAVQGDALEFILKHGHRFDLIAGGPTCTGYSRGTAAILDRLTKYHRLIGATREAMRLTGKPYLIENVEDAKSELISPLTVCWTEFYEPGSVLDTDGAPLWMRRHRLFESNLTLMGAGGCFHPSKKTRCAGAYGGARRDKDEAKYVRKGGYVPALPVMRELLGTPWMTERGCQLSIPPAYTKFLGEQIMEQIR